MKSPSGALLTALQHVRTSAFYSLELIDSVLYGKASSQHNAQRLVLAALIELQTRVAAAIDALEGQP